MSFLLPAEYPMWEQGACIKGKMHQACISNCRWRRHIPYTLFRKLVHNLCCLSSIWISLERHSKVDLVSSPIPVMQACFPAEVLNARGLNLVFSSGSIFLRTTGWAHKTKSILCIFFCNLSCMKADKKTQCSYYRLMPFLDQILPSESCSFLKWPQL